MKILLALKLNVNQECFDYTSGFTVTFEVVGESSEIDAEGADISRLMCMILVI